MGLLDDIEITRKTMVVIFIIDTSGSMEGWKMGAVNSGMMELISEIKEKSEEYSDALIKIAVLLYSDDARWITDSPTGDFQWKNLDASGSSNLGSAFKALNEKLSVKGFLPAVSEAFVPQLFLISGSKPSGDWEDALEMLKKSLRFKFSIKFAVAVGENADKEALVRFAGSPELVFNTFDPSRLNKMIKFIDADDDRGSYLTSEEEEDRSSGEVKHTTPETDDDDVW